MKNMKSCRAKEKKKTELTGFQNRVAVLFRRNVNIVYSLCVISFVAKDGLTHRYLKLYRKC